MGDWHTVARVGDVTEGVPYPVAIGEVPICVYYLAGEYFAIGDVCPHQGDVYLSDGVLSGETIECPMHQSCFSVRDGTVLQPPALEDVPSYAVRVLDGTLLVEI